MQKQTDNKTTAIYYRVAQKQTASLYLDNQMQALLCYANENGTDSFTLYVDVGKSGATLDRPAFNTLQADIETGRIGTLIIYSVSRIARDFILVDRFITQAQAQGVAIISISDGINTAEPYPEFTALFRSFLKGGGRV